jgi:predicted transcriptional regulator YheO
MPLSAYYPLCNAIALLLQPQAEVVLHDLATEAVAHIATPFRTARWAIPRCCTRSIFALMSG